MLRNSIMHRTWKIWVLCLAAASFVTTQADSDKSVTAAQVNGTWATPAGEFKIWALDHHHLRVEFSVAAEHKVATSANTPTPTARTKSFDQQIGLPFRAVVFLLYQTMSLYFDAAYQHYAKNMENLGAVPGHSLICYDAGGQRHERHSRPGERHLENEIR